MFAIIETGGKQYKVEQGQTIDVEKISRPVGEKVSLPVLLISADDKTRAGNPILSDVECVAEVVAHGKADKIVVFKYKPKKNVRKKQGHRQPFTRIKIVSIK